MTQTIDEGIADWFKRNHFASGQKQINKLIAQAEKQWDNYRGRALEDWSEVTWKTLYKWLTTPDNLGLTKDEIYSLLKDRRFMNKIKTYITQFGSNRWDEYQPTILKAEEPIGGPFANEMWQAKIAKTISKLFIEFGSVLLLKRLSGGEDLSDTQPEDSTTSARAVTPSSSLDQLKLAKSALEAAIKEIEG